MTVAGLCTFSPADEEGDSRSSTPTSGARRRRLASRPALIGAVLGALALAVVPAARAQTTSGSSTSGSSTASINVAVRSITVAPGAVNFDVCDQNGTATGSTLTFPNGRCATSAANVVTITNGSAPGHIDVQGADAIPADGGTHWTLCGGGILCTGNNGVPGQDQFAEQDGGPNGAPGPFLVTGDRGAQCDTGFSSNCSAGSNQGVTESLHMAGPSGSTDNSRAFTTAWTWTAVP